MLATILAGDLCDTRILEREDRKTEFLIDRLPIPLITIVAGRLEWRKDQLPLRRTLLLTLSAVGLGQAWLGEGI